MTDEEVLRIRERETPLCTLARKHKTDKGGTHLMAGGLCHAYTPIYHALLGGSRMGVRHVLEIGVNFGYSLRMWAEYFPNAEILGLDNHPDRLHHGERHSSMLLSVSRENKELAAFATDHHEVFELIVDDGSHERADQIAGLQMLTSCLAPSGLYVVEDLQPSCNAEDTLSPHVPDGFDHALVDVPQGLGPSWCLCCKGPERLLFVWRKERTAWRALTDALR